ncbi:hypothetical protein pipiens_000599, partial [Culex pipiens pipiens]
MPESVPTMHRNLSKDVVVMSDKGALPIVHQRIGEGAVEVTVFDKDLYEKRSKYINKPCKTAEGGDVPEQVSSASSIPSCCSTPSSGHRESGQEVYPPHIKVEVLKTSRFDLANWSCSA